MKDIKLNAFTTLIKIIFTFSFLYFDDVSLKWKSALYLFITYFTYMMQKENVESLMQKVRCFVERKCKKCCIKDNVKRWHHTNSTAIVSYISNR